MLLYSFSLAAWRFACLFESVAAVDAFRRSRAALCPTIDILDFLILLRKSGHTINSMKAEPVQ